MNNKAEKKKTGAIEELLEKSGIKRQVAVNPARFTGNW